MYSKTIYTVDVQYKRTSYKVVYFCQIFNVFFRLYNPFPP